jgi:S1-C subfamily serine protease
MRKSILPAAWLASAIAAAVTTGAVHAGHAPAHQPQAQMPNDSIHQPHAAPRADTAPRPRLGVAIAAVPQTELDTLELEFGVRIEQVRDGSVADRAGIEAGDIVTAVDDRPAYSPQRLQHLIEQAGDRSQLALVRAGEALQLQASFADKADARNGGTAALGVRVQNMTSDLKEAFGAQGERGVLISQVVEDSAAQRAGLKAGDVIVEIAGDGVASVRDLKGAVQRYAPGDKLQLEILRDRQGQTLQLALGAMPAAPKTRAAHPHHGHGSGGTDRGFHYWHGMLPGHGCATGEELRPS